MCTEKPDLIASFQDLWCKSSSDLFGEKNDKYVFKGKYLALNTYLSSFSNKSDAKIYIILQLKEHRNFYYGKNHVQWH